MSRKDGDFVVLAECLRNLLPNPEEENTLLVSRMLVDAYFAIRSTRADKPL